ncbi:MAG: Uma2 family endonuclease [Cyanobacteria bacterium J06648_11]
MTVTTYRSTVDRFHRAIDAGVFDEPPVELLNGNLLVMAPERELHAFSNSEVGDYLRQRLGDRAKVCEAHPITLNDESEPMPDLAIVKLRGRAYLEHHPYPEDIYWLTEFSKATLARDLGEKKSALAFSDLDVGVDRFLLA